MLTTILWIIGGLVALAVLYMLAKFIFMVMLIKKTVSWAKNESKALPEDYRQMRKEVENENSIGKPTADMAKKAFVRWYDKFR